MNYLFCYIANGSYCIICLKNLEHILIQLDAIEMLTMKQTGRVVGDRNNSSPTPPPFLSFAARLPQTKTCLFSYSWHRSTKNAHYIFLSYVTSSAYQARTKHFHSSGSP